MIVQKELKKLFNELKVSTHGQVFLSDYDITIKVFDHAEKLSLSAPVYFGGGYIPKSVRSGILKSPHFEKNQMIKTSFKVDEENFRIFLQYLGSTDNFNDSKFLSLVEDFNCLAKEWQVYLDEHDRNDLIYIYSKK